MANDNARTELIDIFPRSAELPEFIRREQAVVLIRRALEASRALVDDVLERAGRVLSEDELVSLGQMSELLAELTDSRLDEE